MRDACVIYDVTDNEDSVVPVVVGPWEACLRLARRMYLDDGAWRSYVVDDGRRSYAFAGCSEPDAWGDEMRSFLLSLEEVLPLAAHRTPRGWNRGEAHHG